MQHPRQITLGSIVCLSLAGYAWGSYAQEVARAATVSANEATDLRWALQQGGLLAVIIIGGFFYRRDFREAAEKERERNDHYLQMMQEAAAAMANHAAAVREQAEAYREQAQEFQRLSLGLKTCQAVREMIEDLKKERHS
jgi:hypothetical protein